MAMGCIRGESIGGEYCGGLHCRHAPVLRAAGSRTGDSRQATLPVTCSEHHRSHSTVTGGSMTNMDKRTPDIARGKPVNASPAMDPIKVIIYSPENRDLITDKAGNTGIPIIPEIGHANDCMCQAPYANNNYESLSSVRACLPKSLFKEYHENFKWPTCFEMGYATPVHKNLSDIYFSDISHSGTVLNRLIRRCPVPQMIRSLPVFKQPQFAHINIQKSESLAASISAQLHRAEISLFTIALNEHPSSEDPDALTRFPSISRLMNVNIDLSSYGPDIKSVEDIMINEPLVDAFQGTQSCEFCAQRLDIDNETTYMAHLAINHTSLLHAFFTCPACLNPTIVTATTFNFFRNI